MIFTWKIFHSDIFLGYQYAITECSAREKAVMTGGSASRYTGATMENITAVSVN